MNKNTTNDMNTKTKHHGLKLLLRHSANANTNKSTNIDVQSSRVRKIKGLIWIQIDKQMQSEIQKQIH